MGVGPGVQRLEAWLEENGYVEGDACFCLSRENAETPPFVQHIHARLEEKP